MGFTRTFADWASGLAYEDLPGEVVPWVKAATLDYLAVCLAGCQIGRASCRERV